MSTPTVQPPTRRAPKVDKRRPAQVVIRLSDASREAIQALAEAEGVTVQALGLYAWSLALQAYGRPPLPEAI